ncbi:peroxiredoxin-like family protein [Geminicoccaceae bacterium 1502E]|nr:peroxiredoxin-like family protein [Geminicoccaceae bacterium 1502E]
MPRPLPGKPAPALEARLVGGGTWRLAKQKPQNFSLVVAYRGLHCPICKIYLKDLHSRLGAFAERGVEAVALSADSEERAAEAKRSWQLPDLALAHSLDLDTARSWGLYLSAGHGKTSAGVDEPALFTEPGVFLVRADGTLY